MGFFKNIFKSDKKAIHQIVMKLSFNDEVIIYPTEKGWEKIENTLGENYVVKRKTEDNGYQDTLWCIIEDLGTLFFHGSEYMHSHFEIITHKW